MLLTICGCHKDKPVYPQTDATFSECTTEGRKVIVINEGNFGGGNSSMTSYDPVSGETVEGMFLCATGNTPGDVAQSMSKHQDRYYLVVNNSGKIEVLDTLSFEPVGTISGMTSPRYILPVSSSKAYVTDLFANGIWVVDLQALEVTGFIPSPGWTEAILLQGSTAYVSNRGSNYILKIDAATDVVTDSLLVGRDPASMTFDQNGDMWVLSTGGFQEVLPTLHRVDMIGFSIVETFTFSDINASPSKLCINKPGDHLYWLNGGVQEMEINATALPGVFVIPPDNHLYYSFNIDYATDELYVGDAIDYVQQGHVYRYFSNGSLIDSFSAGIIPGFIFFD